MLPLRLTIFDRPARDSSNAPPFSCHFSNFRIFFLVAKIFIYLIRHPGVGGSGVVEVAVVRPLYGIIWYSFPDGKY